MKFFDLFAGIGGFHLGLKKNFQCVGACEIDRYARQVYSRHFTETKIWEDATKIKPEELPDFDLLCAGFPCQTFSIAGKRLGFEESRGTLFFEIARITRQKRPRLLLLENVKGLLSHDNGKTFAEILATLDELGYDAEWQVLNSKYFVPQNRERIFIIGHLREETRPEVFPVQEDDRKIAEPRLKQLNKGQSQGYRVYDVNGISQTIASEADGLGAKTGLYRIEEPQLKQVGQLATKFESSGRIYDSSGISRTLKGDCHDLDDKTGLYETQKGIRRLTPLECERLQGFPDEWTEGISDTQRYKCLGNAVTVPVIVYIGEFLNLNA